MCFQGKREWDVSFYLCFCAHTQRCQGILTVHLMDVCTVELSLFLSQHNTETNLRRTKSCFSWKTSVALMILKYIFHSFRK